MGNGSGKLPLAGEVVDVFVPAYNLWAPGVVESVDPKKGTVSVQAIVDGQEFLVPVARKNAKSYLAARGQYTAVSRHHQKPQQNQQQGRRLEPEPELSRAQSKQQYAAQLKSEREAEALEEARAKARARPKSKRRSSGVVVARSVAVAGRHADDDDELGLATAVPDYDDGDGGDEDNDKGSFKNPAPAPMASSVPLPFQSANGALALNDDDMALMQSAVGGVIEDDGMVQFTDVLDKSVPLVKSYGGFGASAGHAPGSFPPPPQRGWRWRPAMVLGATDNGRVRVRYLDVDSVPREYPETGEVDLDDGDTFSVETELEDLTRETARLATKDLFAAGPRFLRRRAAELTAKTEEWVETRPMDTSAFDAVIPNPALRFPFELDQFQKEAIMHIERRESVFVAAHTSAGKTVCCDYAIALALRNRTKCIYTSPIKALSNQKFRDFSKRFGAENVGLITGDVTINGTASCLVVTTEILRSMLYRSADLVSEIETVVFDEIHYICDPDRGVVWEETLIMLDPSVTLVFLSATSPNSVEFAGWIGRIKQQKVYVVFTEKRPIPLEHWIWAPGKKDEHLFKVLDAKKRFLKDGYLKAKAALKQVDEDETNKKNRGTGANPASKKQQKQNEQSAPKRKGFNPSTDRQNWLYLVKDLEEKELLPVVVFAFSKRMCDERAANMQSLNLTTAAERGRIHVVFRQALARLQGSDRELPQVLRVKDLVTRGIGVHHGGLLPILKEVVEILFSQGLVKVLFATETFAIGVNMPARCVVFAGTRKHDGVQFRDLTPGEYTQMAGRAGRRGLDAVGTVIIFGAGRELQAIDVLSRMMTGTASRLTSQFRLTYAMILRLLRAAELSVADMIKRSFSEFGSQKLIGGRDIAAIIEKGEDKLVELRNTLGLQDTEVATFQKLAYAMQSRVGPLVEEMLSGRYGHRPVNHVLPVGRLVLISKGSSAGLCAACVLRPPKGRANDMCVLALDERRDASSAAAVIGSRVLHIEHVKPRNLVWISALKVDVNTADIKRLAKDTKSLATLVAPDFVQLLDAAAAAAGPGTVFTEGPGSGPGCLLAAAAPIDPVQELRLGEVEFVQAWRDACRFGQEMAHSPCLADGNIQDDFIKQKKVTTLELKLRDARKAISDENLALFPDFKARLLVLERLGYISRGDRAVQLKGRVACEINTCDELVLTEMVFADVFGPLLPEECAAVCSALVMQKKCEDEPVLTENLEYARDRMRSIADRLDSLQRFHRVEMNEQDDRKLNFALMEAVYQWAKGMPFKQLMNFTSLEEGFIVRTVTRLDETCREVRNIAQLIGDAELFAKMEEASRLIKRDIVFAASLYVT